MKITTEIELEPWRSPNYATEVKPPRKPMEGEPFTPKSIHVRDLPVETLVALCNAFRADVFRNAAKEDPAQSQPKRTTHA